MDTPLTLSIGKVVRVYVHDDLMVIGMCTICVSACSWTSSTRNSLWEMSKFEMTKYFMGGENVHIDI